MMILVEVVEVVVVVAAAAAKRRRRRSSSRRRAALAPGERLGWGGCGVGGGTELAIESEPSTVGLLSPTLFLGRLSLSTPAWLCAR